MIPFRFCLAGLPSLRLSPAGRRLFVLLLALLTLIALPQSTFASPHTVTITVNTTDDELNQDGDCALREAVQAANTDTPMDACPGGNGDDTILLSSGTYGLTVTGGSEDANATGDLDLLSTMTILGPGAETTFLNGNGIDRVLHIHTDASVTLRQLTLTGGQAQRGEDGGGILNLGTLVLQDSRLVGNRAGDGDHTHPTGGAGGGLANFGTTQLLSVTVSDNQAGRGNISCTYVNVSVSECPYGWDGQITGNGGHGGGVFNGGTLSLHDSIIRDNQGGEPGFNYAFYDVSFWDAGHGGGIMNTGQMELVNVTVLQNAGGNGGGLFNLGSVKIAGTIFDSNRARNGRSVACRYGCPGNAGHSGGGIFNSGLLTVENSSLIDNLAGDGGQGNDGGTASGGHGGGLFNQGEVDIRNSTVADNSAGQPGGHIRNSTVADNSASQGEPGGGNGGGIFNANSVNLTGVAFSANIAPGDGPSCAGSPFTSRGYNLIEDSQGCVITGTQTLTATDILDQPALFGPLRDNGGPTLTQEPAVNSPAVDAIPLAACLDAEGMPLSTDQRGVARPQGVGCDIGAVESIFVWVNVGPDVGATLVYTDTDGMILAFGVPAGTFATPTRFVYRPSTNNLSPGFGWAESHKVFDLVAVPVDPNQNAQIWSDLRLLSPIQVRIEYSDSLFQDTPIIRDNPLTLMIRNQESWQPSANTCAAPNMASSDATSGELQASTCETGHFLVAGATHSIALPLVFKSFSPN